MSEMEEKKTPPGTEPGRTRAQEDQPITLPGIHRFQAFTNLGLRMNTVNLNRVSMLAIAGFLATDIIKPLLHGQPQTTYCYECRACYATQDSCPVGIPYQAELVVSARVADYRRFILNGGLKCLRCGNCQSYCVQNLDTAQIFGVMQLMTMQALKRKRIPQHILTQALARGLVNREYINQVAKYCGLTG